jgi:hypothetical protein
MGAKLLIENANEIDVFIGNSFGVFTYKNPT